MVEESRLNKIDQMMEKLADVQVDLAKMLAVHEQRLNSSEKHVSSLETMVERRREDTDIKLREVYETMRAEDKNIIEEIHKLRDESTEQHQILTTKIASLEKYIWMYIGGFTVITFLITHGDKILRILK
jgi:DNA repair exonuclease SbcCD ATPase subunit